MNDARQVKDPGWKSGWRGRGYAACEAAGRRLQAWRATVTDASLRLLG